MDRREQKVHEYLLDPYAVTEKSPRDIRIDPRDEFRTFRSIFVRYGIYYIRHQIPEVIFGRIQFHPV